MYMKKTKVSHAAHVFSPLNEEDCCYVKQLHIEPDLNLNKDYLNGVNINNFDIVFEETNTNDCNSFLKEVNLNEENRVIEHNAFPDTFDEIVINNDSSIFEPNNISDNLLNNVQLEDYISNLSTEVKEVTLISDGCNYQNRNKTLASALRHTMMEADSVHSTLEKIFKPPIYSPSDYIARMRLARPKQPYNIKVPITKGKYDDLQSLKPIIEKDHYPFYDNLPHTNDQKKKAI
ncbi:hypothetical protein ACI65C_004633 [Semiaphis heraclei]